MIGILADNHPDMKEVITRVLIGQPSNEIRTAKLLSGQDTALLGKNHSHWRRLPPQTIPAVCWKHKQLSLHMVSPWFDPTLLNLVSIHSVFHSISNVSDYILD